MDGRDDARQSGRRQAERKRTKHGAHSGEGRAVATPTKLPNPTNRHRRNPNTVHTAKGDGRFATLAGLAESPSRNASPRQENRPEQATGNRDGGGLRREPPITRSEGERRAAIPSPTEHNNGATPGRGGAVVVRGLPQQASGRCVRPRTTPGPWRRARERPRFPGAGSGTARGAPCGSPSPGPSGPCRC